MEESKRYKLPECDYDENLVSAQMFMKDMNAFVGGRTKEGRKAEKELFDYLRKDFENHRNL